MPDSLTALAILALIGVPGFVYLQLRGDAGEDFRAGGGLTETLSTIFFGLVCAAGGATLSLVSQQERWVSVFVAAQGAGGGETVAQALIHNALEIGGVAFLGALLTAVLFAGVIRGLHLLAKKSSLKEPARIGLLLGVGVVGLAVVGLAPWW